MIIHLEKIKEFLLQLSLNPYLSLELKYNEQFSFSTYNLDSKQVEIIKNCSKEQLDALTKDDLKIIKLVETKITDIEIPSFSNIILSDSIWFISLEENFNLIFDKNNQYCYQTNETGFSILYTIKNEKIVSMTKLYNLLKDIYSIQTVFEYEYRKEVENFVKYLIENKICLLQAKEG